ncbi:hypothetical protein [Glutamicibacter sp. X7]
MNGSDASGSTPSGEPPVSAAQPARRKRARVVAAPTHLQQAAELTGAFTPIEATEAVQKAQARRGQLSAEPAPADPLGQLRAKDEDPRGWGEATEDLAESLRREKPPHWG